MMKQIKDHLEERSPEFISSLKKHFMKYETRERMYNDLYISSNNLSFSDIPGESVALFDREDLQICLDFLHIGVDLKEENKEYLLINLLIHVKFSSKYH